MQQVLNQDPLLCYLVVDRWCNSCCCRVSTRPTVARDRLQSNADRFVLRKQVPADHVIIRYSVQYIQDRLLCRSNKLEMKIEFLGFA